MDRTCMQLRPNTPYNGGIEQMGDTNGRILDEVIKNFKSQRKVKNILLLGLPSAGKSSLINSLVSLILGKYIPVASVGQGDQLTHTYAAHRYQHFGITEDHLRGSPNEVNARIIHQHLPNVDDFVGSGNENTEELKEILGLKIFGHLEPGIQITALCDRQTKYGSGCLRSWYTESKEEWKTDAVVFVHSVAVSEIPKKLIECVLEIIKPKDSLRPVDVDYYVVLTNMDKVESGEISEKNLNEVENAIAGVFGFRGFKEYKLVKVTNWSDDVKFPDSSVEDLLGLEERSLTLNNQLLKLLRNMSITKAEVKPKNDIGFAQEIWFRLYAFLRNNRFDPKDKKDIFFAALLGLLLIIVVGLLMSNKSN
ncbi:hypothetical protein CHS0354_004288 [Potamilus streckersoni]|uniref:Uncharacterized protein n=1 Tax=Potamilus streckersoni TaxID=2493646 RepID=A0AAE0S480_9BIVA|nr:hypothetical protein CHS0354_004288 [Potamilus streckersoni]